MTIGNLIPGYNFFFCLETKETKIQASQKKISKTTSQHALRTQPLALQARFGVRCRLVSPCFFTIFF